MIAHESVHFLKNKRVGRNGYMAIKLDMVKAYDYGCVERMPNVCRVFRGPAVVSPDNVLAEGDAVLVELAQGSQRHDLKPA